MGKSKKKCSLTPKQEDFCQHYVLMRHGAKAARAAGYSGDDKQLSVVSSTNLRKPNIKSRIEELMRDSVMPRIEAMDRLSQMGRADYSIAIMKDGRIDIELLHRLNLTHLIKAISPTRHGLRYEFYNAQDALTHILKIYDTIGDNSKTGKITTVEINVPS